MIKKITNAEEQLINVLYECCGIKEGVIDNGCLSTYEDACDYLASKGLLTTNNGRIYKIKNWIMKKLYH